MISLPPSLGISPGMNGPATPINRRMRSNPMTSRTATSDPRVTTAAPMTSSWRYSKGWRTEPTQPAEPRRMALKTRRCRQQEIMLRMALKTRRCRQQEIMFVSGFFSGDRDVVDSKRSCSSAGAFEGQRCCRSRDCVHQRLFSVDRDVVDSKRSCLSTCFFFVFFSLFFFLFFFFLVFFRVTEV